MKEGGEGYKEETWSQGRGKEEKEEKDLSRCLWNTFSGCQASHALAVRWEGGKEGRREREKEGRRKRISEGFK